MNSPLVSVIIPAFNAERWVEEAVRSVLGQSLHDLEVLVVNDGSTDGTAAVLASITDNRVLTLHQQNAGVSTARNNGLKRARGTYITFLDADDRMTPGNLAAKQEALEQAGVDWVFSDIWRCNEHMQPIGKPEQGANGDVLRNILSGRGPSVPGISSNIFAHRRCFDGGLRFDPALSNQADQDIVVGLALCASYQYIPRAFNLYRTVSGSMSMNIPLFEKDMLHFFAKAEKGGLLSDPKFRRYCLGNAYWAIGGSWWKNARKPGKALPYFIKALAFRPALFLRPFRRTRAGQHYRGSGSTL